MSSPPTMTVTVPATPSNARVVRVMASDAAALADLDFDLCSDLELAVDEAMTLLLGAAPGHVRCRLDPAPGRVTAHVSALDARRLATPNELSELVLGAIADDVEMGLSATQPWVRLAVGSG